MALFMFSRLTIDSPKQASHDKYGRSTWYPYYAGFPMRFAKSLISSVNLTHDHVVLDPWNGSGTTTAAAEECGVGSLGIDLNPAMVLVAKARSLSCREFSSVLPLASDIVAKSCLDPGPVDTEEPLLTWFSSASAHKLRQLEISTRTLLVNTDSPLVSDRICDVSDLAAFFYVALFRTTRRLLHNFYASNPTWIKKPRTSRSRIRPNSEMIEFVFLEEVSRMLNAPGAKTENTRLDTTVDISTGCSTKLSNDSSSIDLVLTSPPYCTRIDYAVATSAELSVLGYGSSTFDGLRRSLLGTSTVAKRCTEPDSSWGISCNRFLRRVQEHRSKASKAYYYKNHVQYFAGLSLSIGEIARVLKPSGGAVLVVQDSYYKDAHNDLAKIVVEMAANNGLYISKKKRFPMSRSMASVNPGMRRYTKKKNPVESVLCFTKCKERK